ncbi:hypothetical protein HB364_24295 [Pseudoflavitalea sp. X16]|uniref:YiiX/YebB-like N1pC/P60 family cysteine hydrolase n=1 Tax=Paraflavitalea devenefica TaxID=2716334 RepID=UPI0014236F03|nr:YiiX/YebB-like N1pC/P60 family cysteine hydrolase [Paraflavitalea devenefica]NII28226.1 hypothetical protein [Paraflavitalea devenefica]
MRVLLFISALFIGLWPALTGCQGTEETAAHPPDEVAMEIQQMKKANDSMIQDARRVIQPGDLVLRTGTDYASEQVKALSKQDRTYSHGGIAVVDSGKIFIYHVEPDNHHVHDKVRKELLDSFCNPAKNLGFAVARYTLADEQKTKLLAYMDKQYRQQVVFDMHFDLKTDDKLYCSEMIKKGLAQATGNHIVVATDRITDRNKFKLIKRYFKLTEKQIVTHDLVPIDHLYLNPWCTVLKRYPFQTL